MRIGNHPLLTYVPVGVQSVENPVLTLPCPVVLLAALEALQRQALGAGQEDVANGVYDAASARQSDLQVSFVYDCL